MNSKLVQINEYILLEFIYSVSKRKLEDTYSFYLSNNKVGWNYFFDGNSQKEISGNVLDNSCIRLNASSWVSTDIDLPTQWIDYDNDMIKTNITSYNREMTYDGIKVHILSGYNLESIDSLICEIALEDNMKKTIILSSQLFRKNNWSNFKTNPRPIFLGDKFYDKYFYWEIPSLRDLNREWAETNGNSSSLSYQLSESMGIPPDSLIDIAFHEIQTTSKEKGIFDIFYSNKVWRTSINQEDTYQLFSATINESLNGDYYEFYPEYNGTFIDDWINQMRSLGGDWIIIHDISVWEQLGGEEVLTSSFSSYQDKEFYIPHKYRPIIVNESAFSFTIEYVCRIFNRKDASQIIRRSSLSSIKTKKYGKYLEKINVYTDSNKIYNKIVQSSPIKINPIKELTKVQNIYTPIFINNNNIILSSDNVIVNQNNIEVSPDNQYNTTTFYGQGELTLFINPIENWIKFTLYEKP